MKSAFSINLEYFALRVACAVVNAIPYGMALSLARVFGWVAFRVFGFQRRRTLVRIHGVFPKMSACEAISLAVHSLQNILMTAVEMARAPKLTRDWMDRHVKDGAHYKDLLQQFVDERKGVVIMVPHSGNWYMAAWSMAKYGLPLFAIGARQRNPKIDAWMKRQYGDVEVLDRSSRNTLLRIHQKLAEGRAFAILPDLRVRQSDVEVDFFGGKANVSHAGAAFAVRFNSPIVVAIMSRQGNRHVFNHLATLRPDPDATDKKEEARRLTRQALELLSAEIMKNPGDWYWFNKRWILDPVANRQ